MFQYRWRTQKLWKEEEIGDGKREGVSVSKRGIPSRPSFCTQRLVLKPPFDTGVFGVHRVVTYTIYQPGA